MALANLPTLVAQRQPLLDESPRPVVASKKGLQVQRIDDAIALGVQHAGVNVALGAFVDLDGGDDAIPFRHGDRDWWFARVPVHQLDDQVAPLSAAGVEVTAILLATQTGDPARDSLVIDARCRGRAPNGIAAFAVDDRLGRPWLAAVATFLAERYSGAGAPHGRIWNWIVGNEVNSHWWWYHLDRASLADVVDAYERAVRTVHDAITSRCRGGRVFVSLEHHWTARFAAGDERQAAPGRELLLAFAALARERGDFPWHVAFHPYPEDLFDCRFWQDETAPDTDEAPRVTFRNLPVLLRFLARDELRFAGRPRRVILSEQGFHCRGDGAGDADGERDQAAAFALAWSIVQRLDGIDAFILHRHVDHAHEGGLRLGLWTRRPDTVCTPDRPRRMRDVFLRCDTDAWPACAAFALPVIGIAAFDDWPLGEAR